MKYSLYFQLEKYSAFKNLKNSQKYVKQTDSMPKYRTAAKLAIL